MNRELALHVLDALSQAGVRELCVCAGARNAPLVSLLSQDGRFRLLYFFEERSASFFGLGRTKATGAPFAVVTTSGTAAGELLPATMEAYYSGLPLVLVTADRPRRFRGTGAPQTAEQVGLFGVYAEIDVDLAGSERMDLGAWSRARPLHVNVCFEEPLLEPGGGPLVTQAEQGISALPSAWTEDAMRHSLAEARWCLDEFRERSRFPVVVVGALAPEERAPALEFLTALGAPVLLESLSGLREHPTLGSLALRAGQMALVQNPASGGSGVWMDGVLRVGSVPTLRLWRDLEESLQDLPLLSLSAQPFSGASRGAFVHAPLGQVLSRLTTETPAVRPQERVTDLIARDRALDAALGRLLRDEPRSEPGLVRRLSEIIPHGARLFLGNSLPIREWDLAATWEAHSLEIGASRGLNGIDGQVSTFLGFCGEDSENWALFGDLTTLYDMQAPWILRQLPSIRATMVVINNGGGKIFDRMFPDPAFQNRHDLSFEHLAQFWGLDYERWESIPPAGVADAPGRGRRLIEIVPDDAATQRFWQAHDALAAGGVDAR